VIPISQILLTPVSRLSVDPHLMLSVACPSYIIPKVTPLIFAAGSGAGGTSGSEEEGIVVVFEVSTIAV
jgi:hypothetical protein